MSAVMGFGHDRFVCRKCCYQLPATVVLLPGYAVSKMDCYIRGVRRRREAAKRRKAHENIL